MCSPVDYRVSSRYRLHVSAPAAALCTEQTRTRDISFVRCSFPVVSHRFPFQGINNPEETLCAHRNMHKGITQRNAPRSSLTRYVTRSGTTTVCTFNGNLRAFLSFDSVLSKLRNETKKKTWPGQILAD